MIRRTLNPRVLFIVSLLIVITMIPIKFNGVMAQSPKASATAPAATVVPTRADAPANAATDEAAAADSGNDTTTVSNVPGATSVDVPLDKLGLTDVEMTSPAGFLQFRFTVPDTWQINAEGENKLVLSIDYMQAGGDILEQQGLSPLTTTLRIQIDDRLVSSQYLPADQTGTQELEIPIPAEVLAESKIRTHTVRVTLDATEYCLINAQVRMMVYAAESRLHLEYAEVAPTFDLATYPVPFYRHSFDSTSDVAYIVLPKNKDESILTAAAAVAASLGRLTNNSLTVKYAEADSLPKDIASENLILIGEPGKNQVLTNLYVNKALPTQLEGSKLILVTKEGNKEVRKDVAKEDGVLQLIANPLNPQRAILTVTGQTPEAMLKAAQSLTNRSNSSVIQGSVALVSEFNPVETQPLESLEYLQVSFSELGYDVGALSMTGRGQRFVGINFPVPLDRQVATSAYVDLKFSYSDNLEGARTTVALLLNGRPFASRLLGEQAQDNGGISEIRAELPIDAITPGLNNTLAIVIDTQGNWGCYPPASNAIFFSIDPESVLSLPLSKADNSQMGTSVTWFPGAFSTTNNLSDVLISLPAAPTAAEFEHAFRLIARLASNSPGTAGFEPRINIGDIPSGTDLSKYHIIAIGRPSTNSLIKTLNSKLAQPFVDNSDQFNQVLDQVTYRMLPNADLGVLQTIRSPWSAGKMVLVISGSTENGQLRAAEALFNPETQPDQIRGDIVFVSEKELHALNSGRQNEGLKVSELRTRSAQIATATAAAGSPLATSTRGPSPTPTPLFTFTPSPTVPTAFPTFAPLSSSDTTPTAGIRPLWIDALFATALLMLVGTAFYMAYKTVTERQRKQA